MTFIHPGRPNRAVPPHPETDICLACGDDRLTGIGLDLSAFKSVGRQFLLIADATVLSADAGRSTFSGARRMRFTHLHYRHTARCCLLAAVALAGGCHATTPMTAPLVEDSAAAYAMAARWEPAPDFIPVLRQGRYTLVELAPASAQRDLMRQLVEINFPPARKATVGDGLRHVLGRSGYRLCDNTDLAALHALPLPATHYRMGPMMLRDALLTLTGPGWDLSVDDTARHVCFSRVAPLVTTPINLKHAVEAGAAHPIPAVVRKPLP